MIQKKYYRPDPILINYTWTDVADGTGVISFKGYVTETSGALTYHLGTADYYSDEDYIEAVYTTSSQTFTKAGDDDFDLTSFNNPRTIKGTAIVNFTGWVSVSRDGLSNGYAYFILKVRKWDGTTETEIANVTTETIETNLLAGINEVFCVPITLSETSFKKGETLRLTIETWLRNDTGSGDSTAGGYGHDPQNRDGTYISPSTDDPASITKLDFNCPFEVAK